MDSAPHHPSSPGKRIWDDAPGLIGVTPAELPPLPDDVLTNPRAGRIDPRTWFTRPDAPFHLEIGTGKGTFLVEQAPRATETNFLGIEWEREFYLYSADRLRRRSLRNARMLHANAVDFLHWRVPDDSIDVIHLYYSDPWPKAKHHKNRVVQHRFLADVWRTLKPGGELRVVTDHDELWAWCVAHFRPWTCQPLPIDARTPPIPDLPLPSDPAASRILQAFGSSAPSEPRPAPFAVCAFEPPEWVQRDNDAAPAVVGTNYERKFTSADHPPHSVVLRKDPLPAS